MSSVTHESVLIATFTLAVLPANDCALTVGRVRAFNGFQA